MASSRPLLNEVLGDENRAIRQAPYAAFRWLTDSTDASRHSSAGLTPESQMTDVAQLTPRHTDFNPKPLSVSVIFIITGAWYLAQTVNVRQAALYLVGVSLGIVFYHAAFGFTSAWRVFIADGRGAGLRAEMVMLAIAVALFFPVLSVGSLFGVPVTGRLAPVGLSTAIGAFLFGVGMQLADGCAIGTLYTVGGGGTRKIVTLAAFIAGAFLATAHTAFWTALPALKAFSLINGLGVWPALAANWIVLAAIAALTIYIERRRHGRLVEPHGLTARHASTWLRGPWPLMAGAIVLAVLNFVVLALSGQPLILTSAFALWGGKTASALGFDVASWPFWASHDQAAALAAPVTHDVNSVIDVGIVLGGMLATALAGRYAPVWRLPARLFVAAVVGGMLLGYGAKLAYGCTIAAYFSGIVSGSLHAWLWLVGAFVGNVLGTRLRPLFGLEV
jgi:uncharacterized membrane protein YedE/YeeE